MPSLKEPGTKVVFVCGLPSSCNHLIATYCRHLGAYSKVRHAGPPELSGVGGIKFTKGDSLTDFPWIKDLMERERFIIVPHRDPEPWRESFKRRFLRGPTTEQEIDCYVSQMVTGREFAFAELGAERMDLQVRDLVEDPDRIGQEIADFIGLPYQAWHTLVVDPDSKYYGARSLH